MLGRHRVLNYIAGATAALVLAAGSAVAATNTYKFAFVTPNSPNDPYARSGQELAKALEEAAPGQFEIKMFPDRQLGDEKELIENLKLGTVDLAVITNSLLANVVPAFSVNDLPFLYANREQAFEILDSELGDMLLAKLDQSGIVGLGFPENGFRSMMNNVRPVTKPEDVAGVKYRVAPSPIYIQMFSAPGGNAVPMAWAEVALSLQKGAIDGLELPMPVAYSVKMYELVKYLSMTNHTYSSLVLMMSKRAYGKLSPEMQKTVKDAAKLAVERQRVHIGTLVDSAIKGFAEKGVQVNEIPDLSAFRERVKPIYADFRPKVGEELMDRWVAAVAKK